MKRLIIILLGILLSLSLFGQRSRLSTRLSKSAGFHKRAIEVSITATNPDATIYYTLDGSPPSEYSNQYYNSPIRIERSSIVRAFSVLGDIRSNVVSKSYFIEPVGDFPTVSVAVKPSYLFDAEHGLFMMGNNADSTRPHRGANFWSRKELIVHTEIFESDGSRIFSGNSGMRLFGGMSRLFPQKSMALVTRSRYGPTRFRHPIFQDKDLKKYKYLVLRNNGSDWGKGNIRDVYVHELIKGFDLEMQSHRPAKLFLNGKYWGIYNIREKINRYFLAGNTGHHKDSVSIIEHEGRLRRGEKDSYKAMLSYMRNNSLEDRTHFDEVATRMDIRNFTDLQITQIFIDNRDAGGNIKFWRPKAEDGKWRWIVYDTDWGFGLHNANAYRFNSLEFHLLADGPSWPNPPWSTFILRNLLKNKEYETYFVNRFLDHINTYFVSKRMTEKLEELTAVYKNEMPRHLKRWNISDRRYKSQLLRIRNFANKRPAYVRRHLTERFDGGKDVEIALNQTEGGRVIINNNIELGNDGFKGIYFENFPISIKAIPQFGYKFSHWDGLSANNTSANLKLALEEESYEIKAVFEESITPLAEKIMINEISCNNKETGDWIELYNSTAESINLKGWYLLDSESEFEFPEFRIEPSGYVVLCQDSTAFRAKFPNVTNLIGNFSFGLSKKKERLQLFTDERAPIDSVYYEVEPRDSIFTLNLLLPYLDNGDPENWELRNGIGSPKAPNPTYLESRAKKWLDQKRLALSLFALVLLYLLIAMIYKNRHHFK